MGFLSISVCIFLMIVLIFFLVLFPLLVGDRLFQCSILFISTLKDFAAHY